MPIVFLRQLTGRKRTESANHHLARYLAFLAGAVNAGGFFAVRQYTSHMSGVVAAMADNLATGSLSLVFSGLAAIFSFSLGAFLTTLCIRWARSRALESEYALPLLAEALLLLLFGAKPRIASSSHLLGFVMLLCFTMGMQNALITKLTDAFLRTTHLTGMVTDIGILLGRIVFASLAKGQETAAADLPILRLLASLVLLFFIGGVTGAVAFRAIGAYFALPLAASLLLLAAVPILDDLRRRGTTPPNAALLPD
jgi:uncharacterized membrane protein YoaK (UPF0700 family)